MGKQDGARPGGRDCDLRGGAHLRRGLRRVVLRLEGDAEDDGKDVALHLGSAHAVVHEREDVGELDVAAKVRPHRAVAPHQCQDALQALHQHRFAASARATLRLRQQSADGEDGVQGAQLAQRGKNVLRLGSTATALLLHSNPMLQTPTVHVSACVLVPMATKQARDTLTRRCNKGRGRLLHS